MHLTSFERQFIAKAAFDWYVMHGYNAELSFFHGMSEYRLVVYVNDSIDLPQFPFLEHSDIKKKVSDVNNGTTIFTFVIPFDCCPGCTI